MRALIAASVIALLLATGVTQDKPAAREPVTLRLASGTPRTLDPHLANTTASMEQCALAYEAPLEYDPFDPARLRPCLLASMPEVSADGLKWTLRLRDDVRFAASPCFPDGKGRAVTSADLMFSLKRLATLERSGGYWLIEDAIFGLAKFRDAGTVVPGGKENDAWWKHIDEPVSGLKAIDAKTLEITLTAPMADFRYTLTFVHFAPVAREAVRAGTLETTPVGTGPFVLARSDDNSNTWTRNPDYRRVTLSGVPASSPLKAFEGRALPLVDRVEYTFVDWDGSPMAGLVAGKLHWAWVNIAEALDLDALKAGKSPQDALKKNLREKGLILTPRPEPILDYIAFNMRDPVVGTPAGKTGTALRKALALATDREKLIRECLNFAGTPANGLTRPGLFGHDPKAALGNQRHDPAEGRRLLEEAGFKVTKEGEAWIARDSLGNQPEIGLLLRANDERAKREARIWEASWGQVGVRANVECLTFNEFLKRTDEGTCQASNHGWVYDVPDATNMLQLLYGPSIDAFLNYSNFLSAKYDELYKKMLATPEDNGKQSAERRQTCREMHAILDAETPWITVSWRVGYTLAAKELVIPEENPFRYGMAKYAALR